MEKSYACVLVQKKACSLAKCTAMVIELRFFMKKMTKKVKMKNLENHVFLYFTPCVIFSTKFFKRVLHLYFFRGQLEIESESEN